MRKIGLIGGMSWASTELYYRHLNKGVQKRLGTACSAPILMESLNYCELSRISTPEQWAHAKEVLIASAKRLQDAGATALMIAANSMHKVAEDVAAAAGVPLLAAMRPEPKAAQRLERGALRPRPGGPLGRAAAAVLTAVARASSP